MFRRATWEKSVRSGVSGTTYIHVAAGSDNDVGGRQETVPSWETVRGQPALPVAKSPTSSNSVVNGTTLPLSSLLNTTLRLNSRS